MAADPDTAVAIEIRNCLDVLITDNRVELSEATAGIYLQADAHDMSVRIHNDNGLGVPVINERNGMSVSVSSG